MIFLRLECLLYPLLPVGNPFHGVQVGLTPTSSSQSEERPVTQVCPLEKSPPGHRVSFREEHGTHTGQSGLPSGAIEKTLFLLDLLTGRIGV